MDNKQECFKAAASHTLQPLQLKEKKWFGLGTSCKWKIEND